MTILEYIRQLPGMEEADELDGCLLHYALDKNADGCPKDPFKHYDCIKCKHEEATINGEPAPYLFHCPVKPGQTVYMVGSDGVVKEFVIKSIEIDESAWRAHFKIPGGFHCCYWMKSVFPTREDAEWKIKEMQNEG